MIRTFHGDLLKSSETLIAHGCNSMGVMGSGIAKQIKLRYPEVYERYKSWHERHVQRTTLNLPLGEIQAVEAFDKSRTILNCITQGEFGADGSRYVSYDAVDICFKNISEYMEQNQYSTIGIPQIGAGLGGGSWDVIHTIINERMKNFNVNVYIL
jgi:O-acetyl-ADP-ribose deacetylase (regulator of RNase III)